jgi:hypothetical protein
MWHVALSRYSSKAEYRVVAHAIAETVWQLLEELHQLIDKATIVYYDTVSTVYLSSNLVQHQRTKHVEIDIHFVLEKVALGQVHVLHVPTSSQYANIFTNRLPTAIFTAFSQHLAARRCAWAGC